MKLESIRTFKDFCKWNCFVFTSHGREWANPILIKDDLHEYPFLSANDTDFMRMTNYSQHFKTYDRMYSEKYGDMLLQYSVDEEAGFDDVIRILHNRIRAILRKNYYKYMTLFNTTILEYNPIWNVDGTETTTTTYGEHTSTDNIGARSNNEDINQYRVPMDSGTKTLTDETTTTNSANSAVDSHISSTHTDSIVHERHGNIGVTSTQHLITEERQVAYFNLLDIIFEDVINEICIPLWNDCSSITPNDWYYD